MERVYCLPLLFLIISTAFIQIPLCVPSMLVGRDTVVAPPHSPPPPPLYPVKIGNKASLFQFSLIFHVLIQNIMFLFGAGRLLCLLWINAGYGPGAPPTSLGKALAQGFLGNALKVPLNLFRTQNFVHNQKNRLFCVFPGINV